jgi:hypothetical protein
MTKRVSAAMRRRVRDRAGGYCEYCLTHEDDSLFAHEPDHIVARKHRGPTVAENLAWTCLVCNRFKGSDLSSIDVQTGKLVRLFNPRTDRRSDHFRLAKSGRIIPLTPVGRVTVSLLKLNLPNTVEVRRAPLKVKPYPPAILT